MRSGLFVNAMNELEKLLDSIPSYAFPLSDKQTVDCQLTRRTIILTVKLIVIQLVMKVLQLVSLRQL
jgi:hypothetical protein